METLGKMPATILEHIKGSDVSKFLKSKIDPDKIYTVILEPEDMAPEEKISEELIRAVEQSGQSIKDGLGKVHNSLEELFEHLDNI
jgi:hypothetical protein